MHLSYEEIHQEPYGIAKFDDGIDIDDNIFYSVPTSFFTVDSRIPEVIRELITEGEGCLKMNYLTGASACIRKAIYELLIKENAEGQDYKEKIKSLKTNYPQCDPALFDIISQIQGMTSDKIHEQSWPKWDSKKLKLIIETLKTVLHEIYVLPEIKRERALRIQQLHRDAKGKKEPPEEKKEQ